MIRSRSLAELNTALSAAQGEFESVGKSASNPFFRSKYAPLPEVVKAATPILAKHGLAVWQGADTDETGELLWTVVLHASGQYIGSASRMLPATDKDGRVTPQAQGSSVTYRRRYDYMAALGLVADEDDDGNAASSLPAASQRTHMLAGAKRSKPRQNSGKGKPLDPDADSHSEPQDGSQDTPDGEPMGEDALAKFVADYKAAGGTNRDWPGLATKVGAKGKKPHEVTEDQATWILIALREKKAAA